MALDCTVYYCGFCGTALRDWSGNCPHCRYAKCIVGTLPPNTYCEKFGHSEGEIRLEATERFVRYLNLRDALGSKAKFSTCPTTFTRWIVVSHEYLRKCARCGAEQRERRETRRWA
jgi:predicted ATP-dependent serine protease